MTGGASSHHALVAGSALMGGLGSLFPAGLKLIGDRLEFVFVLPDGRNGHHATDTEPSDHPFVAVKERMRLGAVTSIPPPRFFLDTDSRWTRLHVELTGLAVRAVIVLPDELTARSLNAPFLGCWQAQVPGAVRLAVDEIARILARCHHRAGGPEPLIDLELGYVPDRNFEAVFARAHEPVRPFIAPVRPAFKMRWNAVTPAQRKAFTGELIDVTTTGRWLRRRPTATIMGLEVDLPPALSPRLRVGREGTTRSESGWS
ncbi:hypothetical protein [Amycolatopsis decaplanina]|uniref:Uncharacterized protein n=1 Tax=Amycolatopsis decaplanina DSM 44594 TaxID=1284240 RepID=M2ZLD3_9PSEU|nr:hypothetical protein [Amycolatopsis decaplanina]EME61718.1 hypothetical protein H074_11115 [Amycolatopsis decaplanina DSM 44594]